MREVSKYGVFSGPYLDTFHRVIVTEWVKHDSEATKANPSTKCTITDSLVSRVLLSYLSNNSLRDDIMKLQFPLAGARNDIRLLCHLYTS